MNINTYSSTNGEADDFVHWNNPKKIAPNDIIIRFKAFQQFLQKLPKKELVRIGWIRDVNDTSSLTRIFFDSSLINTQALFRKSPSASEPLLIVWLAQVRSKAELACLSNTLPTFNKLSKKDLRNLAQLSPDPKIVRSLPALLASFGIILIYMPALAGMKADGAAFKLASGHPVVALSLRFSRLDNFWFTLMHELAHLVLHWDLLEGTIVVDLEDQYESVIEKEANKLAKDAFVDRDSWRNCEPKYQIGDDAVIRYAKTQSLHPSIVAGMLRRESGNYSRYTSIVNSCDVRSIINGHD